MRKAWSGRCDWGACAGPKRTQKWLPERRYQRRKAFLLVLQNEVGTVSAPVRCCPHPTHALRQARGAARSALVPWGEETRRSHACRWGGGGRLGGRVTGFCEGWELFRDWGAGAPSVVDAISGLGTSGTCRWHWLGESWRYEQRADHGHVSCGHACVVVTGGVELLGRGLVSGTTLWGERSMQSMPW